MRKDAPLRIDLPARDRDAPSWIKVGVIAAVGFLVGVAWPRLAGVKIGPSAPSETSASSSAAKTARAPEAPPASVTAKASAVASAPASAVPAATPPQVAVQRGAVLTCKTEDGEAKKGKECGSVAQLDAVVMHRLRKVASCSAAEGQTGKLSFIVNADFASGRLGWDVGKSSSVGNVEGVTTCLKTIFQGASLSGVAHDNPKYTVAYTATLSTESGKGDDAKEDANAKSKDDKPVDVAPGSEGTVAWEIALVRDVPKTGQVVARLPRGSKVKLGSQKEGWFAIKYGDGFTSDGWVYRGALGK